MGGIVQKTEVRSSKRRGGVFRGWGGKQQESAPSIGYNHVGKNEVKKKKKKRRPPVWKKWKTRQDKC